MPPRFPSKVDTWIGVVLVAAPLVSLLGGISAIAAGAWMAGLFPIVFIFGLYGLAVWPVGYVLEDDALVIRFGMMRSRVPYGAIRAVRPTKTMLSSPALSLDRLHVDAGNALGPNISPADREGFYAALMKKAPQLKREGEALVAR